MLIRQFIRIKLPAEWRTAFAVQLFLIKAWVERIEVLGIERVGDEPEGFAEMINLSKYYQSLY